MLKGDMSQELGNDTKEMQEERGQQKRGPANVAVQRSSNQLFSEKKITQSNLVSGSTSSHYFSPSVTFRPTKSEPEVLQQQGKRSMEDWQFPLTAYNFLS